jgi:hypothetical protein
MPKLAGHSFVGECARHTDPLHTVGRMQRVRPGTAGFRVHPVITHDAPGRLGQMLWSAPHEASPLGGDLRAHHGSCSFVGLIDPPGDTTGSPNQTSPHRA